MGLASSAVLPSSRDVAKPRWPAALQRADLSLLCALYSSFRALPTALVPLSRLTSVVGLDQADLRAVADIWNETLEGSVDVWELLAALTLSSAAVSQRTKLAFSFRVWDHDRDARLRDLEVAFMLRALLRGVGRYCRWAPASLPKGKAIREYVCKTFGPETSEQDFIRWSMRQPMVKATLLAFTPRRDADDELDFALQEPRARRQATGAQEPAADGFPSLGAAARPSTVGVTGAAEALPPLSGGRPPASAPAAAAPAASPPGLPVAPRGELRGRWQAVLANQPVNLNTTDAKNGKLTLSEVKASWGDAESQCSLHRAKSAQCMLLTKHEVCLANKLWCFLCECRDVKLDSIWGLIRMLEKEMSKDDSLVAQAQHRHIFKLTNARANPLFGLCVRRLQGGEDTSFKEFLHALCPCASESRLELYLHWHVGNWSSEQAFVKTVKSWRAGCQEHWKKPVISLRQRRRFQADMRAMDTDGDKLLSVADLVRGGAMDEESAKELLEKYDIDGDHLLNVNEYLAMMCPEGYRSKGDENLEAMLTAKFSCITQSWKTGGQEGPAPVDAPGKAQRVFRNLDEDGSGTVTLDELVGHLDLQTAFGLLEVYDEDADGVLSQEEFQCMLRPEVTA